MLSWLLWLPLAVLRWIFTPIPLTLLALALAYAYRKFTKDSDFWTSRGVPGPPQKLPWGNEFGSAFIKPILEFDDWLYNKQGGKKYVGYFEFSRPVLFVGDPDLIRAITIKDFESFTNHREFGVNEDFGEMLSTVNGEKWKTTRAVMSPTFSGSKMKAMYQVTLDNARDLSRYVQNEMASKGEVEMKDSFGRFTMDNIASCAFGVNCNSFVDPNSPFALHAKAFFTPGFRQMIQMLALMTLPSNIANRIPHPAKSSLDFFREIISKTVSHRRSQAAPTRDFLQLLMETKDKDGNRVLTDASIMQQSVLFFIAGYDTTATLLTFAAYSLATSPECQGKVQEEIDAVLERHGGQLTYDAVMEMTYLDRVLSETLRLYSPASRLERESTKDYTLPGTNVNLPKGTLVQIPVFMVHRDPEHYPDPEKFDPDRFLTEEKEKRHPCAYLPFGSGPRNCIAMRFALFEAKLALVAVLKELTLQPTETTPPPPMPLDKKGFLTTPQGRKMPLKAVPRAKEL